ncbi:MAG: PorV/PorQ family protein [Rhodothermia bacterium]|nr:PorV/PorQ family protein [Rhodothermia bacterium]
MMPPRRLLALLAIGWAIVCAPQILEAQPFAALRLETSARLSALGGTSVALGRGDLAAAWHNPALLPGEGAPELGLGYGRLLGTVEVFWLGTWRPLAPRQSAGLQALVLHYGSMERLDEAGQAQGRFTALDALLGLQYRRTYSDALETGAGLKVLYSALERYTALVLALDLGARWRLPRQWTLAVGLRHLGWTLKRYTATPERPEPEVTLAISKRLEYLPLTLHLATLGSAEAERIYAPWEDLAFGGELTLAPSLLVRFGYRMREQRELRHQNRLDMAGLRLGFGLQFERFGLDYAYRSLSTPGGMHLWNLRLVL